MYHKSSVVLMLGSKVLHLTFFVVVSSMSVPLRSISTSTLKAGVAGVWQNMTTAVADEAQEQALRDELADSLLACVCDYVGLVF